MYPTVFFSRDMLEYIHSMWIASHTHMKACNTMESGMFCECAEPNVYTAHTCVHGVDVNALHVYAYGCNCVHVYES